jgi:adenosine/AMP kinase
LELIGSVEEQELLGEESTTPIAVCTGLATLFDGGDMLINNVLNAIEFGQEHTNITYVNDGEVVFAWGGTEEEVLGELKQTVLDELEEESNKEKYKQLLKKEDL